MAIPKFQDFFYPLLKFLSSQESASTKDCYNFTINNYFNLTDDEKATSYASGEEISTNRMRWANMHLKGAGLITTPNRGWYMITPEGKKIFEENPNGFDDNVKSHIINLFRSNTSKIEVEKSTLPITVLGQNKESSFMSQSDQDPTELINSAASKIDALLVNELLMALREVNPFHFEKIVLDLLLNMGYGYSRDGFNSGNVTQKTNDHGIDGIIYQDRLGFDKIYLQAKRYKEGATVGRPELHSFVGALSSKKASKGVFITTAKFNDNAKQYIKEIPIEIVLISGYELAQLMIEYNLGVITEQTIKIKKIDINFFEEV